MIGIQITNKYPKKEYAIFACLVYTAYTYELKSTFV